jgi:DNA-binding IclR family transcriptional regulator
MSHSRLLDAAAECVVGAGRATPSLLERRLRVRRAQARHLLANLEWLGVVGRAGKGRRVLLTPADWAEVVLD